MFIGCAMNDNGDGSEPSQETTEETFDVVALDGNDETIADLDQIEKDFHYKDENGSIYPIFYKKIRINNIVYTVKDHAYDKYDIYTVTDGIYYRNKNCDKYYFLNSTNPPNFQDFIDPQKNVSIIFILYKGKEEKAISFSDLYKKI